MKCPVTPSEVPLMQNSAGVFERYIGKTKTGKKRWRFGTDKATAQVKAFEVWQRWDNRPEGIEFWEDLELADKEAIRVAEYKKRGQDEAAAWKAMAEKNEADLKARLAAPKQPVSPFASLPVEDAKRMYLENLQRRVGLVGSLGLSEWTVKQTTHKLERALSFLSVKTMGELTYSALETLIYTLAARPNKLGNPLAKEETQKNQKKEQISQRTALGLISEVKSFLAWCIEDDRVSYIMPRHSSKLFKIRPEAEEQKIIEITGEQLKTIWDGCINSNARTKDKGKRRRLWILLGLNCGFYGVDIQTLTPDMIKVESDKTYIWKLRRKTRKTNSKLARTKWLLWKETAELLKEYMPLTITANQIRLSWKRLVLTTKVKVSHSNLRDTGAMFMERVGGRELADTYLAHSRKGPIDSYSHPDWDKLSNALERMYNEFVKDAIASPIQ